MSVQISTRQADLFTIITRLLETSIRGVFIQAGTIKAPKHVYRVDDPRVERNLPFCLNHSFANIRHSGWEKYGTECVTGHIEQFEVIIGMCSPIAAARQSGECLKESIYGRQSGCGDPIELKEPAQGKCIQPTLVDGELQWPDDVDESWTYQNFNEYVSYQRILLRSNLLKVFCQAIDRCPDIPGKASFEFTRVEPWGVDNFQGSKLVLKGKIG